MLDGKQVDTIGDDDAVSVICDIWARPRVHASYPDWYFVRCDQQCGHKRARCHFGGEI